MLQVAGLVGGVVALFNGQWLAVIGAWLFAGLIGLAGNRMVKGVEGISQFGQDALPNIPRTVELLRRGDYDAAKGMSRAAVNSFRMGGDKELLPIALTMHAVTLAATRDIAGAENAIAEAGRLFDRMPPALAAQLDEVRELHAFVGRALRNGVPDPSRFVQEFLTFNDAASTL
jgi:hypothetical protein